MCSVDEYLEGQKDCRNGNEPKQHKSHDYYMGYEYQMELEENESVSND